MAKAKQNEAPHPAQSKVAKAILTALEAPYSGTIGNYLSHGATELANIVVHGHAAPMYSHSAAPGDQPAVDSANWPDPAVASPEAKQVNTSPQPATSIVDKYLPTQSNSQEPQSKQAMVTSHGESPSEPTGIADKYLNAIKNAVQREEPNQELSK